MTISSCLILPLFFHKLNSLLRQNISDNRRAGYPALSLYKYFWTFTAVKLFKDIQHIIFRNSHTACGIAACHTVKEYCRTFTCYNGRHIVVDDYRVLVCLRIVYQVFCTVPCDVTAFDPLIVER